MNFIVYGAGAIGGVVGARLQLAGERVQLIARGAHLQAIQRDGLRFEQPGQTANVKISAAASIAELDASRETVVFIAVKSQHTAAVIEDVFAHVPEATVVSLQNGVDNERSLARHFSRVLGACVLMPASHLEPGVVIQQSSAVPGLLDIGSFPHGTEACEPIAAALRSAGFASVVRANIMAWKHRKLLANLFNAPRALIAPGAERDRLEALLQQEAAAVFSAAGTEVVSAEQDRERRGDLLQIPEGSRASNSTAQSLERGTGSIETAYLNGEIGLMGRLHGIPTPANDLVTRAAAEFARSGSATPFDAAELLRALSPHADVA